jgi:hypothetical protein
MKVVPNQSIHGYVVELADPARSADIGIKSVSAAPMQVSLGLSDRSLPALEFVQQAPESVRNPTFAGSAGLPRRGQQCGEPGFQRKD